MIGLPSRMKESGSLKCLSLTLYQVERPLVQLHVHYENKSLRLHHLDGWMDEEDLHQSGFAELSV